MSAPRLADANRTYHEAQSQMELLPGYYSWTYGAFRPYLKGHVVELGSGSGLGISTYIDATDRVTAIDYNQVLLDRLAEQVQSDKLVTLCADLTGDWQALAGLEADTVVMMDVLEHFADDKAFLEGAAGLLKPGGQLAVKVPAGKRLYSDIDEASGHYRRYDRTDLEKLAWNAGLAVTFVKPINRLGAVAYRMKRGSGTNFSKSFSPGQLKMINAALPLIRLVDLVPGLPGLSHLAVMRKEGA